MTSQATLAFPAEGDADDRATRKPKKKRRPPVVQPDGVFENCGKGKHRLCAVTVVVNGTLETVTCACTCHQW